MNKNLESEKFCLSLQSQNKLVEQRTENPCVPGSIPGDTTLKIRELQKCDSLFRYMDLGLKWLENGALTYEKFKLFIGFKNMVCCNMCVSTDGYKSEVRVMSMAELYRAAIELFRSYSIGCHLDQMKRLQDHSITEAQFAQFLGKSRMYQFLPNKEKKMLPEMFMTDTQINLVTKAYYNDEDFGRSADEKELSMWKMYNLLTGRL